MTTTTTEQPKWTSTAGPLQTKAAKTALDALRTEHKQFVQLDGIIGGPEGRHNYCSLFSQAKREDVTAAEARIGERFNYAITRENYKEIVAAVAAATRITATNANRKTRGRKTAQKALRFLPFFAPSCGKSRIKVIAPVGRVCDPPMLGAPYPCRSVFIRG